MGDVLCVWGDALCECDMHGMCGGRAVCMGTCSLQGDVQFGRGRAVYVRGACCVCVGMLCVRWRRAVCVVGA